MSSVLLYAEAMFQQAYWHDAKVTRLMYMNFQTS